MIVLVPVIVLHFVQDTDWRLAIIVLFSLVFTGVLVLGTDAKRSEIFGASAAFVAVQVVYVGAVLNQPS